MPVTAFPHLTSIVLLLVCSALMLPTLTMASVGLSLDTSALLATTYVPTGNVGVLQPQPNGNGWSIQMWLKYAPTVARTHVLYVQLPVNACVVNTFDNYGFSINTLASDNVEVQVQWCSGSLSLTTTTPLLVGEWQHLTVVFRKLDGIFIYYNSKIVRSSLDVLPPNDPNLVAFTWTNAIPFVNSAYLTLWDDTGLIDELRYWNTALSHGSVSSNYCRRLSPSSSSGLVALWNFDSNLDPIDHVTRVFLNTTFDLGNGLNNILYSPTPLMANQLVQEETNHWCSGSGANSDVIIIIAVIGSLVCLIAFAWILAAIFLRYRNRNSGGTSGRRRIGLGGDY
jgi:hypothetical protein